MVNFKTISQMFYQVINDSLDKEIFYYKVNTTWNSLTGKDILSIVKKISFSLYANEIYPHDKVSILSNTSYKWALCDYGILCMGGVTTTIYPSLLPNKIEYIINDSQSKLVFVEDEMQLEKIKSIIENCKSLKKIVVLDNTYEGSEPHIQNLNSLLFIPIHTSHLYTNSLNFFLLLISTILFHYSFYLKI